MTAEMSNVFRTIKKKTTARLPKRPRPILAAGQKCCGKVQWCVPNIKTKHCIQKY
jgi:hypothetical protein